MNLEDFIGLYLESILFALSLVMVVSIEFVNRRRQRTRSTNITRFIIRESINTTDSFADDTDIMEFIKQTQFAESKVN